MASLEPPPPTDQAPTDQAPAPADAARRATRPRRAFRAERTPWRPGPMVTVAVRGASLAAAAAVGALVGFGLRTGASLARLGVVTMRLRGLPEFVTPDRNSVGAALLGGTHVALVTGAWGAGVAAAVFAAARRGVSSRGRAGVAAFVAFLLFALDAALPAPLRLGAGSLDLAERLVVAALAAAAGFAAARHAPPAPSADEM